LRQAKLFLATLIALPFAQAVAQNYDVLARSPRTSIYVETVYPENEGRPGCDWYATADDYLVDDPAIGRDCIVSIRVRGVINRDGALAFSDIVDRADGRGHSVSALVLDSKGGDADAAISIARLIRQSAVFSAVPVVARVAETYQSVCFSACVVLLSAAYGRELEFDIDDNPDLPSRIGIHGPGQFDRQRGSYDTSTTNSEIMRVSRRLKDYFASIGVAEKLVDDMFAVPFDEIRLLSRQELVDYGLYAD
jgi:hypothetical protein